MRAACLVLAFVLGAHLSPVRGQQGQVLNRSLQHDGLTRSYILYVPPSYTGETAWPLVLNLHGLGDNAAAQMPLSGMNAVADTGQFLVAYPTATVHPQAGWTQWNEGSMFPNGPDDVGFISALMDEVESGYRVNPSKVYATGFSLGGIMSYYLSSQLSDRLAAVASVAGQHIVNPTSPRPLPVLHMHGTADSIVPIGGGYANVPPPLNSFELPAITEVIDAWRENNNCISEPVVAQLPDVNTQDNSTVETTHYEDCDCYATSSGDERPAEVLYYKILGGGHTWPGGAVIGSRPVNRDINASEEIWEFFSRHELPAIIPELPPGDFNVDGTVDAADYVVWRNGLETTYTQSDYNAWRANFGRSAAGAAAVGDALVNASSGNIPEPSAAWLLFYALSAILPFRRSRRRIPRDPRHTVEIDIITGQVRDPMGLHSRHDQGIARK